MLLSIFKETEPKGKHSFLEKFGMEESVERGELAGENPGGEPEGADPFETGASVVRMATSLRATSCWG